MIGPLWTVHSSQTDKISIHSPNPLGSTCAGVIWRRGAAAADGHIYPDPNPSLHAWPGALPATPGSHRHCQRAGWCGAAAAAARSVHRRCQMPRGCWVASEVVINIRKKIDIQYYQCFTVVFYKSVCERAKESVCCVCLCVHECAILEQFKRDDTSASSLLSDCMAGCFFFYLNTETLQRNQHNMLFWTYYRTLLYL